MNELAIHENKTEVEVRSQVNLIQKVMKSIMNGSKKNE